MGRLCIIRHYYYPQQKNTRRNAESLVNEGHEVDVICLRMKGQKKRETLNGIHVYRLPLEHHRGSIPRSLFEYTAFFIMASLEVARLSLKKRYHVVEVNTMPDFLVFTTLFPRLLGTKVILYLFENMPALFASTFKVGPNHIGVRVLRLIERTGARYAHKVICSDGPLHMQAVESNGIPGEKITVVLNVPEPALFEQESLPAPDNGEGFRMVVVSNILPRYGVDTVVRAVPLLIKDIPELRVDVLGDGEYLPDVERLARELGVTNYINFAGWVTPDMVPRYVSRAHIGIAPMLHDVGLPNKLFDYFALGKPTVASALPSLLASFDNDFLLYYEPGDERELADRILELYHSSAKRASLASNAKAFYVGCRWPIMKREYIKAYEELLA
jgi:glycosyltransferase involved in cell wall biosynthesis